MPNLDITRSANPQQPSAIDLALQSERDGVCAEIFTFVRDMPECSEADVIAVWQGDALANRPADRKWLLLDPKGMLHEYRANLFAAKLIPAETWEAQRAWILAEAMKG